MTLVAHASSTWQSKVDDTCDGRSLLPIAKDQCTTNDTSVKEVLKGIMRYIREIGGIKQIQPTMLLPPC